jgi:inhibitor of KinA sporulation pathway (predicted exonuclease)
MKMIFVDLELNQPSNSIIQIGAVCMNLSTGKVVDSFDVICNPGEYPNDFITKLTGITKENVMDGQPLKNALSDFWRWVNSCSVGNRVAAWGRDVQELIDASVYYKLRFKWPKQYDVKQFVNMYQFFASENSSSPNKLNKGLFMAVQDSGLDFVGTQHNAYDDALNTANIFYLVKKQINEGK